MTWSLSTTLYEIALNGQPQDGTLLGYVVNPGIESKVYQAAIGR
jgi:hypothetical protein